MRARIAAVALLFAAAVSACSGSSSSGTPASYSASPTPTYTQLGTLSISQVLDVRRYDGVAKCPNAATAFPKQSVTGAFAVCDPSQQLVLLAAPTALDEGAVEATTAARQSFGHAWAVDIELTKSGARAYFALTQQAYEATGSGDSGFPKCHPPRGCNAIAIVYNGKLTSAPAVESDGLQGGLLEIAGLTKATAKRMAAALNPS